MPNGRVPICDSFPGGYIDIFLESLFCWPSFYLIYLCFFYISEVSILETQVVFPAVDVESRRFPSVKQHRRGWGSWWHSTLGPKPRTAGESPVDGGFLEFFGATKMVNIVMGWLWESQLLITWMIFFGNMICAKCLLSDLNLTLSPLFGFWRLPFCCFVESESNTHEHIDVENQATVLSASKCTPVWLKSDRNRLWIVLSVSRLSAAQVVSPYHSSCHVFSQQSYWVFNVLRVPGKMVTSCGETKTL